jgi:hypothetical protein
MHVQARYLRGPRGESLHSWATICLRNVRASDSSEEGKQLATHGLPERKSSPVETSRTPTRCSTDCGLLFLAQPAPHASRDSSQAPLSCPPPPTAEHGLLDWGDKGGPQTGDPCEDPGPRGAQKPSSSKVAPVDLADFLVEGGDFGDLGSHLIHESVSLMAILAGYALPMTAQLGWCVIPSQCFEIQIICAKNKLPMSTPKRR